jgi:hypothetical protein
LLATSSHKSSELLRMLARVAFPSSTASSSTFCSGNALSVPAPSFPPARGAPPPAVTIRSLASQHCPTRSPSRLPAGQSPARGREACDGDRRVRLVYEPRHGPTKPTVAVILFAQTATPRQPTTTTRTIQSRDGHGRRAAPSSAYADSLRYLRNRILRAPHISVCCREYIPRCDSNVHKIRRGEGCDDQAANGKAKRRRVLGGERQHLSITPTRSISSQHPPRPPLPVLSCYKGELRRIVLGAASSQPTSHYCIHSLSVSPVFIAYGTHIAGLGLVVAVVVAVAVVRAVAGRQAAAHRRLNCARDTSKHLERDRRRRATSRAQTRRRSHAHPEQHVVVIFHRESLLDAGHWTCSRSAAHTRTHIHAHTETQTDRATHAAHHLFFDSVILSPIDNAMPCTRAVRAQDTLDAAAAHTPASCCEFACGP